MNPIVRDALAKIDDPVRRLGLWESYEERCGIKEFEALMPREQAEREALSELQARVSALGKVVMEQKELF